MEKFGIFELLDTLSALLSVKSEPQQPEKESAPPSARDTAFAPPAYGGAETTAPEISANNNAEATSPEPPRQNTALSAFLARHDAVSKKADDKK